MTSRDRDEDAGREAPPAPWHNRTSTVLGASVAGLAAIAIVVTSISFVSRQFSEPEQAPINYVGPAFSETVTRSSTPTSTSTTTATVTSTSPPITSDINPDPTPASTATEAPQSSGPIYQPPRTREEEPDDDSTSRTTRKRPRTNVTRTLNPVR